MYVSELERVSTSGLDKDRSSDAIHPSIHPSIHWVRSDSRVVDFDLNSIHTAKRLAAAEGRLRLMLQQRAGEGSNAEVGCVRGSVSGPDR